MNLLPIVIRYQLVQGTRDKVTFPATMSSIGRKFGTHFGRVKKPSLCGQFGTKRLS